MIINKLPFTGERLSLLDIGGMNEARYKFVTRYTKGKRVLELGCAFGYGSYYLAQNGAKHIVAIDSSRNSIKYAEENYDDKRISYCNDHLENFSTSGKFDVVVALELIEHLKRPEKLLDLAKISLTETGVFIVSTPNRLLSSYDGDKPTNPYHVREYYPKELCKLLKQYFNKVDLYGILLKQGMRVLEKDVQRSLRWRVAAKIVKKRWLRRIVNYLPEKPKRLITGEVRLDFKPSDYIFSKKRVKQSPYLIAVCRN